MYVGMLLVVTWRRFDRASLPCKVTLRFSDGA